MKKSLQLTALLALCASSFASAKVAVYATLSDIQEDHWGIFQFHSIIEK